MAEEDLIFGKNRHFFGGIEPSNMLAFSVAADGGVVKVTATLPADTIVNGQTLCTVEGAIIRRKTTGYPTDEFDGDLVANIKTSTTFADTGASASTYEADGLWYNNSQVDNAFVGGYWNHGLVVGPFSARLDDAVSYSNSAFGAALSCKPLAAA